MPFADIVLLGAVAVFVLIIVYINIHSKRNKAKGSSAETVLDEQRKR